MKVATNTSIAPIEKDIERMKLKNKIENIVESTTDIDVANP